jgi:cyclopropane-fatty-acyl-phospholipid synthase
MPLFNRFLLQPAEERLANLPLPCSVQLPGGQRIGAAQPLLRFIVRDGRAFMHLAQGAIGRLAEKIMSKADWRLRADCAT